MHRAGHFIAFLFLLCGAARLARFNIQKNPVPKNPGRPDRKYFVGLPIPAAAARWPAVVYCFDSVPITVGNCRRCGLRRWLYSDSSWSAPGAITVSRTSICDLRDPR